MGLLLLIHAEILVGVCCGDKRLLLHVVGDPTDAWEAGDCDVLGDPEGGAVRADMGALLRGALSVRDDCRFVSHEGATRAREQPVLPDDAARIVLGRPVVGLVSRLLSCACWRMDLATRSLCERPWLLYSAFPRRVIEVSGLALLWAAMVGPRRDVGSISGVWLRGRG